jgi:hypothetical protein
VQNLPIPQKPDKRKGTKKTPLPSSMPLLPENSIRRNEIQSRIKHARKDARERRLLLPSTEKVKHSNPASFFSFRKADVSRKYAYKLLKQLQKSKAKTFKPTTHSNKTANTGQKAGEKMQETQKEKTKENASQTKTLDFKIDASGIGSETLYPCCISGNCALYFYYEDLWREEQEKENKTAKQQSKTEEEK